MKKLTAEDIKSIFDNDLSQPDEAEDGNGAWTYTNEYYQDKANQLNKIIGFVVKKEYNINGGFITRFKEN